jgi:hypothetical protein
MLRIEKILLYALPLLGAVIITFKSIRDIEHSKSSTAAIGYIFVPIMALAVFLIGYAFCYAVINIKHVLQRDLPVASWRAIMSYILLLAFAIVGLWYASITGLDKQKDESVQKRAYFRYKGFFLTAAVVEGKLLENKYVSQEILEDMILNSDYSATRHLNLASITIDRLVQKIPATDSGILANLANHASITPGALDFLASRREKDFSDKDEWNNYATMVLSSVAANEKLSKSTRTQMRKYSE